MKRFNLVAEEMVGTKYRKVRGFVSYWFDSMEDAMNAFHLKIASNSEINDPEIVLYCDKGNIIKSNIVLS